MVPGNWLLPRRNFESPTLLTSTIADMRTYIDTPTGPRRTLRGYHQAPRRRAGSGANNAVNPAFREMLSMLILSARLPSQTPSVAEVEAASREMREDIIPLFRSVAPEGQGGGAYLNEANVDFDEGEWQGAFYGEENYKRLVGIKERWDPGHVFYATTAVGSEGWVVRGGVQGVKTQNGRLCRV